MTIFLEGLKRKIEMGKAKGASVSLNVNTLFDTPAKRMAAAVSGLNSSLYGRGNLIQAVEKSDGTVGFKTVLTGEIFDDINSAVNDVSKYGLADIRNLGVRVGSVMKKSRDLTDEYGAAEQFFANIKESLSNLSNDQKDILSRNGIDLDNLDSLQGHIMTMLKADSASDKGMLDRFAAAEKTGKLGGIFMPDDAGGRIFMFTQKDANGARVALDNYRTHLLLSVSGNSFYSANELNDIFGIPDHIKALDKLAAVIEKAGKRARAFLAPREISLSGDVLESVVGEFSDQFLRKRRYSRGFSPTRTLSESTLFLDPEFEILTKFAASNDQTEFESMLVRLTDPRSVLEGRRAEDIAFYYQNLDANQLVEDINRGLQTFRLNNEQLNQLRRDILDAQEQMITEGATTKWNSDRLKKILESKYQNKIDERTFVENFFKSIEQSVDGSDIGNRRFLNTYISQIREEVRDIEAQINSATNRVDKNQLIKLKNALEDKISRIERGDVYQITGRGRVRVPFLDEYFNLKNAMSFENEFQGKLQKYAMIVSRHSLKKNIDIAGREESLILSGIGNATDTVYADFVSASFNPGLFIDPKELQRIRTHHQGLIRQFQEAIDTGIIPEKVKNNLRRQASIDIEGLAVGDRQAAIRSKEYAQELLALLDSGVSVKDSPRIMNLLHKSFESMAFKEKVYNKESFYAPALPETHRFALDTERSMLGIRGVTNPIQLTGDDVFETLNIMGESGQNYEIRNISKFRISGHKALLPMQDVGKFFNALGGFDLDDKGIVRTVTFGSENNRMLGFYMFRQPSGPEEIIFYRMQMDQESIRGMFGHEAFQSKLKEMVDSQGGVYQEIQDIFASDTKRKYTGAKAREIENALANVAYELGDTYGISEKGLQTLAPQGSGDAATLMLRDLVDAEGKAINPAYTKPGIYRTLVENETFDFSEDLFSDLNRLSISDDIKTRLRATTSTQEAFEVLRDLQMSNRSEEVSSIIGTIVDKMQRRKLAQQGGNLGTYVNRSAAASSILDQYSAYLGDADASVRNFLTGDIRYKAGLIAQETAIDASVNLSVSKRLHQTTAVELERTLGNINEANLSKSLQNMLNVAKLRLDPARPMATITIDDIGQAAISSMGRIIGYSRATGSTVEGLEKGLGIDMFTLKNKLTNEDRRTLLDEVIAGMEEAQARIGTAVRQGFGDELVEYKGAADDERVLEVLSKNLGLTSESKWATIEGLNEIGRDTFKIMDTMYRKNIRRGAIDPILQMSRSSIQEDALAGAIFDQYAEDIGQFYKTYGDKIRNMSEVEKYSYNIAKRQVGENLLERIGTLSETAGVTKSGLFNAMEKIGSEVGLGLIDLKNFEGDFGSDLATQTYNAILKNKKLNRINYFLSRDQQNATQILDLLERQAGTQTRVTVDNMKRFAEQLLNGPPTTSALQENVLKALANRESEIQDSAAKRQANFEAEIIRQRFAAQELLEKEGRGIFDVSASSLEDEIDDVTSSLQRQGTRDISDVMQTMNLSPREQDSIKRSLKPLDESSTSVKESIFKRFSLNEFKDLFKNKAFRTGAIAAAGLVVGSFVYSSMKTRNHEVSQSPPLLPAGSPYEENLPAPKVSLADLQNQGYETGVSYNVNLYGDKSAIARFNQEAGKLGNANINTTIYNSIPNVSRDPYRELASSY